jgi:maleate cis-trans isomerase
MSVEYAPRGLIGVLTPQANTTVEPEFSIMLPPGLALINARMMSAKASLEARLADYLDRLDDTIAQFANAPVSAIALGTTGTSYMAGAAREAEMVEAVTRRTGAPLVTTGRAVVLALRTLNAGTIGLVSPYPESLTQKSIAYWSDQGFAIGEVVRIGTRADTFHPIYTITAADAQAALMGLEDKKLDAVVLLGTGMPTLGTILAQPRVGGAAVISCMMCLGWAAIDAATRQNADHQSLLRFSGGQEWGPRLRARMVPAP